MYIKYEYVVYRYSKNKGHFLYGKNSYVIILQTLMIIIPFPDESKIYLLSVFENWKMIAASVLA